MSLGHVIRTAREQCGWSQEQLAGRAGVGQGSVSRLERGAGSPSWSVFVRLLDAMDMEPAVAAVRKTASLDVEAERLRELTPVQRWETQYVDVPVGALSRTLSGVEWAVDGSAALLAYGVPATVVGISVALVATDANLALVLDRFVRRRWVEVGGASAASGTTAFPDADCAAIMRDIATEGIVVLDWPITFRLVDSLDVAAATAALARWAAHVTLGP